MIVTGRAKHGARRQLETEHRERSGPPRENRGPRFRLRPTQTPTPFPGLDLRAERRATRAAKATRATESFGCLALWKECSSGRVTTTSSWSSGGLGPSQTCRRRQAVILERRKQRGGVVLALMDVVVGPEHDRRLCLGCCLVASVCLGWWDGAGLSHEFLF
ncbi:hypothetical protein KFL_004920070 [Klebsormidium nitens]|uniref:Uncharacterized protein n=1 Tax=Klebsormidium nitens TaxID=105231 RepID=A0A1Y1IM17_KLENI|nr:hypothetical protein KFL_004920070 [Klebsormidium nitens]|eukprot:GAQ89158.1 hypothetical protein KFL_004920070 [Klebsormidium nitens]